MWTICFTQRRHSWQNTMEGLNWGNKKTEMSFSNAYSKKPHGSHTGRATASPQGLGLVSWTTTYVWNGHKTCQDVTLNCKSKYRHTRAHGTVQANGNSLCHDFRWSSCISEALQRNDVQTIIIKEKNQNNIKLFFFHFSLKVKNVTADKGGGLRRRTLACCWAREGAKTNSPWSFNGKTSCPKEVGSSRKVRAEGGRWGYRDRWKNHY